jgi:primary-amine oxidase
MNHLNKLVPTALLITTALLVGCLDNQGAQDSQGADNGTSSSWADSTGYGNSVEHPLDALTQSELAEVIAILADNDRHDDSTRFPEVSLQEPTKAFVYAWQVGDSIPRSAKVVGRQGSVTFEAVVDISNRTLIDWHQVEDVQSALLLEEWMAAGELWKTNEVITDELERRGYALDKIFAAPLTTGYFGAGEARDKRLMKLWLLDTKDAQYNLFAKPIRGISATVDINQQKIFNVIIDQDVGRNDIIYDYDAASTQARTMKKVTIQSNEGDNFSFEDGLIKWDKWQFHFRLDKRFGAMVSLAAFDGQSVAYQISANEMFVPYMSPEEEWKYRSFMDIGEYGFGLLSSALELGTDVPGNATLLNAVIPTDNGTPALYENVIGVFERNTGRPMWRHSEMVNGTHEGRAEVELVVRTIPVVGNYDYIVDYVFSAKGLLKIEVGATGMDAVKAAKSRNMADATALEDTKVGSLVAPNLVGVNHDHFISFRIDMDVAGINNSLVTDEITPVRYPDNSRLSGWEVVEHPTRVEGAMRRSHHGHAASWRVVNKNVTNKLGQHKSYQILGHSHLSNLDSEDFPQKRAAWSAEQLWVTPHNPGELYPSGKYPNQSDGSEGILQWVAQQRSVDNTDLVMWYTMGFHHVTLPEDWPILATMWHTVTLRPAFSYERNPAVDIAR